MRTNTHTHKISALSVPPPTFFFCFCHPTEMVCQKELQHPKSVFMWHSQSRLNRIHLHMDLETSHKVWSKDHPISVVSRAAEVPVGPHSCPELRYHYLLNYLAPKHMVGDQGAVVEVYSWEEHAVQGCSGRWGRITPSLSMEMCHSHPTCLHLRRLFFSPRKWVKGNLSQV